MGVNKQNVKIHVEHLKKNFGNLEVLRDVSTDIYEGEVVVILGPSGSGKSTFLRCLNRLHDCTKDSRMQGQVELLLDGEMRDISRLRGEEALSRLRRQVGMVFQKPNPFPKSIFENVAYGLRVNGVKDENLITEKVELALRRAALWNEVEDRLSSSALGLSGGQQQRLCIARALAVEPEVLLMDEPTSALDPGSTMKVEELMSALKKNYTVVIVTHNMQQAARISDRTAFFLLGELVEVGPTNQIFSAPQDKRTEDYISGRFG